jgi:hypothetical protein
MVFEPLLTEVVYVCVLKTGSEIERFLKPFGRIFQNSNGPTIPLSVIIFPVIKLFWDDKVGIFTLVVPL